MADRKETSKDTEEYNHTDTNNNERHNSNARAAADHATATPRISTDNL